MSLRIVVKARYAPQSKRGCLLGILTIVFLFSWLLGVDALLHNMGQPNSDRPAAVRISLFVTALTPFVLWYAALLRPTVARRLGLIEALPAWAVMDLTGLTLSFDGVVSPPIPWDAIASLERSGRNWRLVGTDGSELATIPEVLMYPRPSWSDAPTFAELVVHSRPDRFALRGARYEPGLTEFAIRQPNDLVGRPRQVLQKRVLALGIALAVVAFALLIANTPTG